MFLIFNNITENKNGWFALLKNSWSPLSTYCKTNGELKSPSCPLCNYVFVLHFRLFSKSSINLSVDAEYTCSVSKGSLQICCNLTFTRFYLFFLLSCLLYVVCALLVPFLLTNRVLRRRGGGGRKRKKNCWVRKSTYPYHSHLIPL